MVRGFISSFMGAHSILNWDSIILKVLLYGRECESDKQRDFYVRLRACKDAQEALGKHLTDIFGVSYNDDSKEKVEVSVSAMLVDTRQKKYRSSFYS